jgi:ELWxxDGT repeat protein
VILIKVFFRVREEKMAKQLVMFAGMDSAESRGLWLTDGTAGGTYELTGIAGAYANGSPYAGGIFGGPNPFFD